ncbi:hypothetical protein CXG81DRAFT_9765 [Caulochytrium protostelioides]|uniref:PLOD1-3-like GT domain-containing protein n=1 Tax=Caulochytrium protostelioides TaxID=1555241 RepID=A0A4P9XDG7_9FUNG|nr:hypothetical protein CXG81DRAFT_9765 [Caulochytrium protostelioides]|eukprot:RKP03220.1 hypothetical protein CXG81DRAFT_9765 [Caulochytrium protostelioides]
MLRGNLNAASGADAARAADAAVARRDPSLKLPQPPARSTGAHGATGLNAAGYAPIVWGECTSATQPGCDLVWAFFATKCKSGGSDLANALEDAGIPLAALGLGDPWMGWGHRIRRIHDWLLTVPDETLVIMSDADDVFLLPGCSREEVVARYHDQDADVVWMSEKFIWPQESLMLDYPAVPPPPPGAANVSPFPFLNAGGAMGRARALRQMIWDIYQHDCYDDQLSYTQHFLRHVSPTFKAEAPLRGSRDANTEPGSHPNATDRVDPISGVAVPRRPMVVKLDYYNHLFLSTAGVSLGDIEPDTAAGRIRQRQTGGRACILHQNGNKLRSDLLTDLKKAFKTGRWPVPAPMAT